GRVPRGGGRGPPLGPGRGPRGRARGVGGRRPRGRRPAIGPLDAQPVNVLDWLLEGDPSIRWQALRHLADASPEEVAAERARVATEGAGARLLSLQAADGTWGGTAWNHGWDSTMHALWLLREFGLDPA